ncbi:MAG: T9SS type A sorting domain-containing protein [Candidatus Eisenbacteria bacterium]
MATLAILAATLLGAGRAEANLGGDWGLTLNADFSATVEAVETDPQGNIYIAGSFGGSITPGIGGPTLTTSSNLNNDVFIAKLSPTGQHIWSAHGVGSDTEYVSDIDVLPSGAVVVVGSTLSPTFGFGGTTNTNHGQIDGFGAYFSSTGTIGWQALWGGPAGDYATGVAFDTSSGTDAIVCGSFRGTVNFGNGNRTARGLDDWFLLDIKPWGAVEYDAIYGGPGSELYCAIDIADDGGVAFLGNTNGDVDMGNGTLTSAGSQDMVLARIPGVNATSATWSERFGSSATDAGSSVVVEGDRAIYFTGSFRNTVDFGTGGLTSAGGSDGFIAAYKWVGVPVWSYRMGGNATDFSACIDLEGSTLAIGGFFLGNATFGPFSATAFDSAEDVFVATLDTEGNWLDFGQGSGPTFDLGFQVAMSGTPIVVGSLNNDLTFEDLTLTDSTPASWGNGFVTKLIEVVSSSADEPALSHTDALQATPARPNPTRTGTSVSFRLPGANGTDAFGRSVRVSVHDITGRTLRVLSPELTRDSGVAHWDGRDRTGLAVPSGVYFLRVATSEGTTSVPVTIQR